MKPAEHLKTKILSFYLIFSTHFHKAVVLMDACAKLQFCNSFCQETCVYEEPRCNTKKKKKKKSETELTGSVLKKDPKHPRD